MERGAEAVITETEWDGQPAVRKDRVRKGYRAPELDARLRTERTRSEENLLIRARRAGIRVPTVWERTETVLVLERLPGQKVKQVFENPKLRNAAAAEIGRAAARLHRAGIVHGDLTPANMIWLPVQRLALIDFGLGFSSSSPEDHATDLYVLKEALQAGHAALAKPLWNRILRAYRKGGGTETVVRRLAEIGRRRRYRGE